MWIISNFIFRNPVDLRKGADGGGNIVASVKLSAPGLGGEVGCIRFKEEAIKRNNSVLEKDILKPKKSSLL